MRKKTSLILLTSATVLGLAVGFDKVSANAVNDYVIAKGWSPSNNTMAISDALPKYAYRNGVAKPEGVIVHETGNPSDKLSSNAIWNEINYMLNNYSSAFVHSFVDGNNRIEIANSDYLAWGAGPSGNARYIQTEQVQVNDKDAFAGELYNLATMQARYLIKYNLKPELGKTVFSHAMISSMFPLDTNHSDPTGYWADMAAHFYGTTYTMNDYEWLLEQVYNQMAKPVAPAKYKVGDKVQIASFALNEANGYDLTNRQNWIGTIKSVKANSQSSSNYEYYIDYGNDVRSEHVLEQDIKAAPASKYKAGDLLKVADFAISESNGYDLTNHRGWTGVVKSVEINNAASSHYAYYLSFGDGSRNEHVLEQDVVPSSDFKYKVGQTVMLSNYANVGGNGENLSGKRQWIGKITKISPKNQYSSKFAYTIDWGNGQKSESVLEQDLVAAPNPKFATGQKVQISQYSNVESNGTDMTRHRGKIATIKSATVMNKYSSHYEYYVEYGDGTRSEHVLEQDLSVAPDPKYKTGQSVKVSEFANVESNGTDMVRHRGKTATIKSVAVMNKYSSHYEYFILYPDGTRSEHVLEQDLI